MSQTLFESTDVSMCHVWLPWALLQCHLYIFHCLRSKCKFGKSSLNLIWENVRCEKPPLTPRFYKTTKLMLFITWLSLYIRANYELISCRTNTAADSSRLWNLVTSLTRTWWVCLCCAYCIKALWMTVRSLVLPWTATFARCHNQVTCCSSLKAM